MIRAICEAPTLRMNKHSITRIMSIEMETVIGSLTKSEQTHNVRIKKGSSITMCKMHTEAHAHAHIM